MFLNLKSFRTFVRDHGHGEVGFHVRLVQARKGLSGVVGFELGDGQELLVAGLVGVAATVEPHEVVVQVRFESENIYSEN
jgi:hypothetical protein